MREQREGIDGNRGHERARIWWEYLAIDWKPSLVESEKTERK